MKALSGIVFVALFVHGIGDEDEKIYYLKARVEECQEAVQRAQCELARAKARLAEAEGDKATVIRELRKVVDYYDRRSRRIKKLVAEGRECDPASIDRAELELGEARSQLAKAQGQLESYFRELRTVLVLQEREVRRMRDFYNKKLVSSQDLNRAQDRLDKIVKELKQEKK